MQPNRQPATFVLLFLVMPLALQACTPQPEPPVTQAPTAQRTVAACPTTPPRKDLEVEKLDRLEITSDAPVEIPLPDPSVNIRLIGFKDVKGNPAPAEISMAGEGGSAKIMINKIQNFRLGANYSLEFLSADNRYFSLPLHVRDFLGFKPDNFYKIPADASRGYSYPYYLYLPPQVGQNEMNYLLVAPNNTGRPSDDLSFHESDVLSSIQGGWEKQIADQLGMPLLIPVFPRPETYWKIYTHYLDRDTLTVKPDQEMLEKIGNLERLDLQLKAMTGDAIHQIAQNNFPIDPRVALIGFSASASFAQKFALLHPEMVSAVTAGGFNATVTLPLSEYQGVALPYPIGVNDLKDLTGQEFNETAYRAIPQYFYMGERDDNDATEYRDGWEESEAQLLWQLMGRKMMPTRLNNFRKIFKDLGYDNITFRVYGGIGHAITQYTIKDVAAFYAKHLGFKPLKAQPQPEDAEQPELAQTKVDFKAINWSNPDLPSFVYDDPQGDAQAGPELDIQQIRVIRDDQYIYVKFDSINDLPAENVEIDMRIDAGPDADSAKRYGFSLHPGNEANYFNCQGCESGLPAEAYLPALWEGDAYFAIPFAALGQPEFLAFKWFSLNIPATSDTSGLWNSVDEGAYLE